MKHNYIITAAAIMLGSLTLCCNSLCASSMSSPYVHIHSGELIYVFSDVDSITFHSSTDYPPGIIFPQDSVVAAPVVQDASPKWKLWSLRDISGAFVSEDRMTYMTIDTAGVRKQWKASLSTDSTKTWSFSQDRVGLYANQLVTDDASLASVHTTLVDLSPESGEITFVSADAQAPDNASVRTFIPVEGVPSDLILSAVVGDSAASYSFPQISGKWTADKYYYEFISTSDTSGSVSCGVNAFSSGKKPAILMGDVLNIADSLSWKIISVQTDTLKFMTDKGETFSLNKYKPKTVEITFGTVTIKPTENDTIMPVDPDPDVQIEEYEDDNEIIIIPFEDKSEAQNFVADIKEAEDEP